MTDSADVRRPFKYDDDYYEQYVDDTLQESAFQQDIAMSVFPPPKITGGLYEMGSADWLGWSIGIPSNAYNEGLYEEGSTDWLRWVEICNYIGWNANGPLKPIKYRGFILPFNVALGVSYKIWREWRWRVNSKRPIRIAVVGEAGSGKTAMAIYIARITEGLNPDGTDRFTVGQIAFTSEKYVELQDSLGPGKVIIAEETAYSMAART